MIPGSPRLRWTACGAVLTAALLAAPLLLFAWLSHVKFGVLDWSYYVPYEEFRQRLVSAQPSAVYYAPLLAVNVTSGFIIANMFTYTLGHTLVTVVLVTLLLACLARVHRRARARGARLSRATVAGAMVGLLAITAASSSAALTGCHGAGGMGGGIIALAGLGSASGSWLSEVATWIQFLLLVNLAVMLVRLSVTGSKPGLRAVPSPSAPPPCPPGAAPAGGM